MTLLTILDNNVLHLVAETLAIVIGSLLMGILLAYLYWGGYKRRTVELTNKLDFERNKVFEVNAELDQLTSIRNNLVSEVNNERSKSNAQAKTIFDLQQRIYNLENQINQKTTEIDQLNSSISQFQEQLKVIETELTSVSDIAEPPRRPSPVKLIRANYEHVSQLLGKQVVENDLTVIAGIGPRTASLLQAMGIDTWELLAATQVSDLRQTLDKAGGNYKSLDPTHWPRQAAMAAQSEWRKLRVFQQSLKPAE